MLAVDQEINHYSTIEAGTFLLYLSACSSVVLIMFLVFYFHCIRSVVYLESEVDEDGER